MSNEFWPNSGKVKETDRVDLIRMFLEEEVKNAIFDIKQDAAPGPNGFGVSFFQKFWEVIKNRYYGMFLDFHKGDLDTRRLNYGAIILVPKVQEANTMKQYRPICLLNVEYKGFTKVLTERLTPVAKDVIGANQTRFIKGRNIVEGVIILHEVIHSLRKDRRICMILKIDFEKAYDRVRWDFLEEVLNGKRVS